MLGRREGMGWVLSGLTSALGIQALIQECDSVAWRSLYEVLIGTFGS